MNSILRRITNEMFITDTDNFYRKVGNYSVKRHKYYNDYLIEHFYYGNKICKVSIYDKTFELYNCGYKNYRLTSAQLIYLYHFYKEKHHCHYQNKCHRPIKINKYIFHQNIKKTNHLP